MALPGLDQEQVLKAARSLLKYVGQQQEQSKQLLEEDEVIYMLLALKAMPNQKAKNKPIPLAIPHPLYDPEAGEICLFVKDHAGEGHKEAKKKLEKLERRAGIAKVVGLSKLRTKYESHEAKRQLCSSYDLFLADERILPSLPKLIGKAFFKKKKQPIPINIATRDWAAEVRRACTHTYMFQSAGTSLNVRVARSSMTAQQVAANALAALQAAVGHIPKKWANVQGVFLKTADSVALPVYQTLPEAPAKIATGAAAGAGASPVVAAKAQSEAAPAGAAAAAAKEKKPQPKQGAARQPAGKRKAAKS